jgi:phosphopantetheinyl transferase (holo-ACP synthase)
MKEHSHVAYTEEIVLRIKENSYKAFLGVCNFCDSSDYYEKVVEYFHPNEKSYYSDLKFKKRIKDYTIGRYCAKLAVADFIGRENLNSIHIRNGLFNHPIVSCGCGDNIQVSITHCDHIGMAVTFLEDYPLGIDLENISDKNLYIMEKQLTPSEKKLINDTFNGTEYLSAVFWAAKESLSKVLKTGFIAPLEIFEIDGIGVYDRYFLCTFKNFPHYKAFSSIIGKYVFSLAYPRGTEINLNLNNMEKVFGLRNDSSTA